MKLSTGKPLFGVNSAGKEDQTEDKQQVPNLQSENGRPEEPVSAAEPKTEDQNQKKETTQGNQTEFKDAPEFKPDNEEIKQNLESVPGKVNGNINQASAEPQIQRKFEVPQDLSLIHI